MMPSILKYFLTWFPMLLIAIANGTLREFVLKKFLNDLHAHQLSTLTLIIFLGLYIGFIIKRIPPHAASQALLVGLFWVTLTLLFEFGFGRIRGNSWEALLHDYNIIEGRLWIFVPIFVAIAPYVFYRIYFSQS